MTNVLIVGKTKMGYGVCLGGLVLDDFLSVRLIPETGVNHPFDTPFNIGDLWDLTYDEIPLSEKRKPHTEDVILKGQQYCGSMPMPNIIDLIETAFDVPIIRPSQLFESRIRFTRNNKGFIYKDYAPQSSVGFWRLNKTLELYYEEYDHHKRKPRYRFDDGSFDVKYVEYPKSPEKILPAGTILRFSLTQEKQNRFWLQLSGWFDYQESPDLEKALTEDLFGPTNLDELFKLG